MTDSFETFLQTTGMIWFKGNLYKYIYWHLKRTNKHLKVLFFFKAREGYIFFFSSGFVFFSFSLFEVLVLSFEKKKVLLRYHCNNEFNFFLMLFSLFFSLKMHKCNTETKKKEKKKKKYQNRPN